MTPNPTYSDGAGRVVYSLVEKLGKPYYDDGGGRVVFHGDCRELLPLIEQGTVDLVLTDPPYGISYVTSWRLRRDKLRVPIANDETLETVAEAWPMVMRVLNNNRHWYSFASPRRLAFADELFPGIKHVLAWDKGDRGTVGDLECGFGEAWEAILYGMKGRRALIGKRPRTVVRYDWSSTMDPLHPTVKPIPLLRQIISWSTDEGEIVIDPFAGSGTTLQAAKDMGRYGIGIELEERYCEIAAKRLQQAVLF
jgi:site-specific DNA-methyltransferase (adenine-specific)